MFHEFRASEYLYVSTIPFANAEGIVISTDTHLLLSLHFP